jgi:hypothetical protein
LSTPLAAAAAAALALLAAVHDAAAATAGAAPRPLVATVVPARLVDSRGAAVDFAGGAVGDAVVVVNPIWTGAAACARSRAR